MLKEIMKQINLLLLLLLLFAKFGFSQKGNLEIKLSPQFAAQPFELGNTYPFEDSEISFETLKFYISDVKFLNQNQPVWEESDSYRLIDLSELETLDLIFEMPEKLVFDKIQFQLGIDSTTHDTGVMGGDLDPTKGMYWSWNTGYINFKLEGKSPLSKARDKSFQFHLGGYLSPFPTVQIVELDFSKEKDKELKMDISKFLSVVDLTTQNVVMSAGAEAKKLSEVVAKCFYFNEE